ncbi:hypothetical protein HPP92_017762 [Vanilla planifolia]|uniref:Uncharacterized protein n=1 Tax=Vanilla planifolia TaxID=51239 RepID=A0A835QEB9_VANPL|nr:hypothetical protein HPP92_017762 [Vanilla planifolia]
MASCGGDGDGACESYCRRTEDEEPSPQPAIDAVEEDNRGKLGKLYKSGQAFCFKCGEEKPVWNGLCLGCFRSSLFGKFKLAVTSNAMISPAIRSSSPSLAAPPPGDTNDYKVVQNLIHCHSAIVRDEFSHISAHPTPCLKRLLKEIMKAH